jgi:hypothetical protein
MLSQQLLKTTLSRQPQSLACKLLERTIFLLAFEFIHLYREGRAGVFSIKELLLHLLEDYSFRHMH